MSITANLMPPSTRQKRQDEKSELLIQWLARHGFISVAVAKRVLGLATEVGARAALRAAARQGWVEIRRRSGGKRRSILIAQLSQEGIARAELSGLEVVELDAATLEHDDFLMREMYQTLSAGGVDVVEQPDGTVMVDEKRARFATSLLPRKAIVAAGAEIFITLTSELAEQFNRLGGEAKSMGEMVKR
ncbi:hypothetical protein ACFQ4M_17310 [Thauera mechernichensis]|uniref:Uncharacterized protein n=1 Tax=Thauera mechernichensis TaxID=82788 RepID=A0ABW3WI32_9RHOO|nr:hypothetical protein [Thauera mechernichensis]MDG3066000.1 hypothetical protein [Thauera mechernichensis]